jgi:hypothetical protein
VIERESDMPTCSGGNICILIEIHGSPNVLYVSFYLEADIGLGCWGQICQLASFLLILQRRPVCSVFKIEVFNALQMRFGPSKYTSHNNPSKRNLKLKMKATSLEVLNMYVHHKSQQV